ncbi:MAG: hypothetical protein HQ555_07760 [Candidatus Aminicenantes bacterium]|nr:hypothetical protein [Candidatus Aminicenantes bacterium]
MSDNELLRQVREAIGSFCVDHRLDLEKAEFKLSLNYGAISSTGNINELIVWIRRAMAGGEYFHIEVWDPDSRESIISLVYGWGYAWEAEGSSNQAEDKLESDSESTLGEE